MRRRAFVGLCGVGLFGLFESAWAADDKVKVGLTDGLYPGLKGKKLDDAAKPFRSLFETATGLTGRVLACGDGNSLTEKLKKDEVQLGVFQGIELAWARLSHPKLEPIALLVNQSRTLRAYLIVAAASPVKKPAELSGKTLAMPEDTREHCQVFLQQACIGDSTPPNKFFKKLTQPEDVETALDDVVDGRVTATVVDGVPWSSYREAKPGAAKKLRVLRSSEPFPCSALVSQAGRFDEAWKKRVRNGLVAAKNSRRNRDLLQQMRLTGFEAADADYEKLLAAAAKAYPPPGK